jgi:arylsulfatase A-like enzyme
MAVRGTSGSNGAVRGNGNTDEDEGAARSRAGFVPVLCGTALFFLFQYVFALLKLGQTSGGMRNKFSALARDKYMDFLIWQNVQVLFAYAILAVLFAVVLRPLVSEMCARFAIRIAWRKAAIAAVGALVVHAFFVLRLVETRPYFLDDARFGHWYYEILNVAPDVAKPVVFFLLFKALPVGVLAFVVLWYWRNFSGKGRAVMAMGVCVLVALAVWKTGLVNRAGATAAEGNGVRPPNVILIGSDSLRGDRLGYTGYRPRRTEGMAAAGVSPRIDALAARSVNLENCFTPIGYTLESGTSMMASMYPHTHGLRHMYPDKETVEAAKSRVEPLAAVLAEKGYDTAVFGDWCAGYFELMPLGFKHVSVSSFDNFKIYMSQAVVMAHFVIPLYFDHPAGYAVFPQLGSFAQFVTPEVVTERVKKRLADVSESGEPFFWNVFYSCNHLPFRSPEPYSSMFADPAYEGANRSGVDFDIDSFIGGTDLENKWKALPEKEIRQIRDLYDGCTRQFDDNVGMILDALEERGLAENTIVIITSDHGDNLYEEGVTLGHGLTFNGGARSNHVPLLFHVPGTEAATIPEQVRTIDIAPTLADLLGAPKPGSWEGQSFAGWLSGAQKPAARAFYGETGFPFIQFRVPGIERPKLPPMDKMNFIDDSFNYQFVLKEEYEEPLVNAKQRCLMSEKWKLVCTPTAEGGRHFALFSRHPDPYSETDVADAHPAVLAPMKAALERWMDERVETPLEDIFPDGE